MRPSGIVPAVLLMLSTTPLIAPSNAETPRAYLIEAKLTATLPDGREKVLAWPCLIALERHEACIHLGQDYTPPKGVQVQEPLRGGTYCLFKVFREDGQVFLDATVNKSVGQTDADGVSIGTTGVRIIKAITLGKKITALLDEGCVRCEVLVQDASKVVKEINSDGASPQAMLRAAPAPTPTATANPKDSTYR